MLRRAFQDTFTRWTFLFFALMTVFAVVFAKERFQADGAHYLLHVVQSENFRIEHQRYILIFSQLLAWLGVKVGASLNTTFILNSLNPVLWFFGLFLYAVRFLKDKRAAIGIILTSVLGVLHIQFIPMYEIYYGIPLVLLLYAHIINERVSSIIDIILFAGILCTALFAHPLLPIPIIFVLLYSSFERHKFDLRLLIVSALVIASWYVAKKLMLTEYEAGKMALVTAEWNTAYKQLYHISYYGKLLVFFSTWYTVPLLLLVCTCIFLFVRKMKIQLVLVILFFFGHILVVNFTHENDPVLTPYFERMYLPLIPIVLIPFLFTLCRELQFSRSFIVFAMFMVVGWRMARFAHIGHMYLARTYQTEHLIAVASSAEGGKFVMNDYDFRTCYSWADWSYVMETLLRSSAINPQRSLSIAIPEDMTEGNNATGLGTDEFLFRRWDVMKDSSLNGQYFILTNGKYITLPSVCR